MNGCNALTTTYTKRADMNLSVPVPAVTMMASKTNDDAATKRPKMSKSPKSGRHVAAKRNATLKTQSSNNTRAANRKVRTPRPRGLVIPRLKTPLLPKEITTGEKYDPAMRIKNQAKADQYFEACVQHNMSCSTHTRQEAETIERQNIGYWAGFHDSTTAARVFRLFRCSHPIFGTFLPKYREAFEAGRKIGKKTQRGK